MPVLSGGLITQPGRILFEEVTFTEAGAAGVYTGSVTVPGNSWLLDIKIFNTIYWTAATSAAMIVGDVADPNGWYDDINLKATDIVDTSGGNAECIDFNNAGGQEGAYLVVATGERALMYAATDIDSLINLHNRIYGQASDLAPMPLAGNIPELIRVTPNLAAYDVRLAKAGESKC